MGIHAEKPQDAVLTPDTYRPSDGTEHRVANGESWVSLAASRGIDPWDLIVYNFPGLKGVKAKDFQLAARNVNWYLREYIGCTQESGTNFAFSNDLKGGRGVHQGGRIFLPPKKTKSDPPPPAHCDEIEISDVPLPNSVLVALSNADIVLPKRARCLHGTEVAEAQKIFAKA